MINFLTIVLLVFGVLQIILFFKLWGMTNDVKKIKSWTNDYPTEENALIREAQLLCMNGDFEEAAEKYKKAFRISVIKLYEKVVSEYGDREGYQGRDDYYAGEYAKVVSCYKKMMKKINISLDEKSKFDSFNKINAMISKP